MDYTPCEHGNHEAGCMFCQAQSPTHTQQAITAYLAEVPLPEGWTEEVGTQWPCVRYWQVIEGFDSPFERVIAGKRGTKVLSFPAHWPAIPLPVLLRAAVQCHRLREAGRA